ncbi:hypothetical protein UlMin_033165 [Ulmus minor]
MEAEKAKENEEFMSKTFNDLQKRVEELTVDCSRQRKLTDELQDNLALKEEQNETFQKVVDKFYQIRQDSFEKFVDVGWDEKCARLLHDPVDMWSFNDASTAKYISSLEEELERARKSVDNFQNKLRMGLEIENHLKMKVRELEKKNILANAMIKDGIAELWHYHSQCRVHITSLLDDGRSHIKSVVDLIDEKIRQSDDLPRHNLTLAATLSSIDTSSNPLPTHNYVCYVLFQNLIIIAEYVFGNNNNNTKLQNKKIDGMKLLKNLKVFFGKNNVKINSELKDWMSNMEEDEHTGTIGLLDRSVNLREIMHLTCSYIHNTC